MTPPRVELPSTGAWIGQAWGMTAAQLRACAATLEAAGYRMAWVSEAFGREPFVTAALLLAATRDLVVGTGIANMWVRDPMATAGAAHTLGEAWPGRFVLGVGVSHQPLVAPRGHQYDSPLALARDHLTALGDVVVRAPAPDPRVPVVVGALGDGMLALAAELSDGAHPYLVTPDHTARARRVMGDQALLAPEQSFVLATDATVARDAGRTWLATYLRLDNYVRSLRRQGFDDDDLRDGGSDRLVDALVAWGDEADVADRVRAHRDAGADHVAVQPLAHPDVADPVAQLVALAPAVLA